MATPQIYRIIPETAWRPAVNADHELLAGADVVEVNDLALAPGLLSGWPAGIRVLARRKQPYPGAQLQLNDVDGHRLAAFAANTIRGHLADLELRHRRRARARTGSGSARTTGLTNLHSFDQNRCALVMLASELIAWTQLLAFDARDETRRWEPKKLCSTCS